MKYFGFKNFINQFPLIFTIASIDQISKFFAISFLKTNIGMTYKITSFFSFVYAWNYGISFGFLGGYFQYSNYAFLVINCLIVGYLIALINSSTSSLQTFGYSFIIGGAIGNIIDRIIRGAVFDFIFFHYAKYNFPVFNLADAFINIGVLIIIISLFRGK